MNSFNLLVLSDSHGDDAALTRVLNWAQKEAIGGGVPGFNAAVFLGDGSDDLPQACAKTGFSASWNIVRGNGDLNFNLPPSMILEVPGSKPRKLFLTHGNAYRVAEGEKELVNAALSNKAQAALFGHTHIPFCGEQHGVFLLNPGSIGRPRTRVGPTFAVLECPPRGPLSARFFVLAKRGIKIAVEEWENFC